VNLPVLGWQISIGYEGLPNACATGPFGRGVGPGSGTGNCAFEDTFFPYFFKNVPAFSRRLSGRFTDETFHGRILVLSSYIDTVDQGSLPHHEPDEAAVSRRRAHS